MTIGRRFRRARTAPASQVALGELAQIVQPPSSAGAPLDRVRYLRVAFYFARVFLSFIGWNLILGHLPGFRALRARHEPRTLACSRPALSRVRRALRRRADQAWAVPQHPRGHAARRRSRAELRGLQDEVPAETLEDVRAVIEGEFKRPVEEVYAWLSPTPEAAASLAQVHLARLIDGEEVVVKVQRLRIEQLVETDLAALRLATNWLKLYRPIQRHADLDRLYDEFARTTRAELDFVEEGRNADRFAANFAGRSWHLHRGRLLGIHHPPRC